MGEKKMAKYKESLVKKIRIEQEENQKQKKLQEKYGINENVRIVERNNMGKFFVKTIGKCIRIVAVIILFILAAIGLTCGATPSSALDLSGNSTRAITSSWWCFSRGKKFN